jgi:hypothetical protein
MGRVALDKDEGNRHSINSLTGHQGQTKGEIRAWDFDRKMPPVPRVQ